MLKKMDSMIAAIFLFGYLAGTARVTTGFPHNSSSEMVLIKPFVDVKYFDLPTSDEPVVSWMDIQKGIYPNTSIIQSALSVGEPITIFVYLKDKSNLYDIMVTDCWAYENQQFAKSKKILHLNEEHSKNSKKSRIIDKWYKHTYPPGNELKAFLYTDLTSFKFPDQNQIYIRCDIQLCFKSCEKLLGKKS